MTRDEAARWLSRMKWIVADAHYTVMAGEIEDAELRLPELTIAEIRQYADYLLPPGKRGRVKIVLRNPYEARALALTAAILRSIT
jgi:hypothetical protein